MSSRSLLVPCDPSSAARVRHTIADDLAEQGVAESCVDDVVLVTSELLGNAIVHAGCGTAAGLDVTWEVAPDAVTVRVRDDSSDQPQVRTPGPEVTRGRGLAIVAALSREWGVRPATPSGKQVWATVPIRAGAASHRQPA